MIANIIKHLQKYEYYGAGEYTEIAKGKNEMVNTWKDIKRKVKRKRYK